MLLSVLKSTFAFKLHLRKYLGQLALNNVVDLGVSSRKSSDRAVSPSDFCPWRYVVLAFFKNVTLVCLLVWCFFCKLLILRAQVMLAG